MKSCARLCIAAVFALGWLRCLQGAVVESGELPVLTTTAQVHSLSAAEAQRAYPVRLRGVITFYDQKHFDTGFVRDETGSISVLTTGRKFQLTIGDVVDIRGVSDAGSFAPMLKALEVDVVGHGELPPPRKVTFEELATGQQDSEWVELSGIVRSVAEDKKAQRLIIDVATGGGRLMTRVRDYDAAASYGHLVDSAVRVRGVCSQLFNQKRQMFNVRLLVPGLGDIIVEQPAPTDPFAAPVHSIVSLLQFAPAGIYGRRVRVQGVVTFQQPGRAIFIRDETESMFVQTRQDLPLAPGDRVDAIGFPSAGEWNPILQDAEFRKIGHATLAAPASITAEQALSGAYDAGLVQIEGTVVDRVRHSNEEILVLTSGGRIFDAVLENPARPDALAGFLEGSKVRSSGVCVVEVGGGRTPRSFRILMRSPQDVVFLVRSPWWTLRRLLWSLGGVSVITLAGWIWVAALGRRVRLQTAVIRQKIQREGALEERARLAREFHDTLEQQFTGIRLQLEAVKSKFSESPPEAEEYLDVARSLIRHSHDEARRTVWDLRSDVLERHDLSTALEQTIASATNGAPRTRVAVSGLPRRLPSWMENHLLRIGQEAVTNAIKHARASEVQIDLDYRPEALQMRVRDDGCGFDADCASASERGHFGLLGMKERAEKIRGRFLVSTARAAGTVIEVTVPLDAADADLC
ncbi:MAG TPA: sensor histidine kinase [Chthoniobacter sp.]|nr:sensor histidine kinase [Chthoniobacter sp.]